MKNNKIQLDFHEKVMELHLTDYDNWIVDGL